MGVADHVPSSASSTKVTTTCLSHSAVEAWCASPLATLHLNREVLLNSWQKRSIYHGIHAFARVLPALVIYGGTFCLLVCAVCQYRRGMLLALTLYSIYMVHWGLSFLVFSGVGLLKVYLSSKENWREKFDSLREKDEQVPEMRSTLAEGGGAEGGNIGWNDVIHVIIIPSYKSPRQVLVNTLLSMTEYSLATTNLVVCLTFEEREAGCRDKAAELLDEFRGAFRFMFVTVHPPNLPHHVPGKSSNVCWAFFQLCIELEEVHGIASYDPRVVVTVVDDDSHLHRNYFDALTYSFLSSEEHARYITTWQPPICNFRNYLRQPIIVRISSLFATLSELVCLANPMDCHINYSGYSMSLILASTVGGWDPQFLAEDWHMFAKCALMTEGQVICQPIFLPLLNYTPEAETYWSTMASRWTQAKRHALGVSELVYVMSSAYLALLELRDSSRIAAFLWRIVPLLGKMAQVHFVNGMSAAWNMLAQLVIHFYMRSCWCYLTEHSDAGGTCSMALSGGTSGAGDQIGLDSWFVHWQRRAAGLVAISSILSGGFGAFYFHLVKDRVEGDVDARWSLRHPLLMWLVIQLEVSTCGLPASILFGAAPLWLACIRIIHATEFRHVVAGMVGRSPEKAEE